MKVAKLAMIVYLNYVLQVEKAILIVNQMDNADVVQKNVLIKKIKDNYYNMDVRDAKIA